MYLLLLDRLNEMLCDNDYDLEDCDCNVTVTVFKMLNEVDHLLAKTNHKRLPLYPSSAFVSVRAFTLRCVWPFPVIQQIGRAHV